MDTTYPPMFGLIVRKQEKSKIFLHKNVRPTAESSVLPVLQRCHGLPDSQAAVQHPVDHPATPICRPTVAGLISALIKDGLVQPGLGPYVAPGYFQDTGPRARHIPSCQIFDRDKSVFC